MLRCDRPPRLRRFGSWRDIFLLAQPPLLCEEGIIRLIHTMPHLANKLLLLALVLSTVGCDRVTKHLAATSRAGEPAKAYLGRIVQFEYAENRGGFLSLGADLPPRLRTTVFTFGTGVSLLVLTIGAWWHQVNGRALFGLGLFVSGGISNLFDRVVQGSVIDFMHVGVGSFRTGIFNVADLAILLGGILIATTLLPGVLTNIFKHLGVSEPR